MRTTLLPTLMTALCCLAVASPAAAQEVQWRYDYNAARKEALQKGVPLLLDFGNANCYWCRRLDETTFKDAALVRTLNTQFVPLKIDGDREAGLTQALRIQSYPTLVLAGPDGKILGTLEGYQDVARVSEAAQRALAAVGSQDGAARDCAEATKAVEKGDYARAVALLRPIADGDKGRPVQQQAEKLLHDLEARATAKLASARKQHEQGQSAAATGMLTSLSREFAGTRTAREAGELLASIGRTSETKEEDRARRAKELLAQAVEDRKGQHLLSCLDRCELLIAHYGDLPEAGQAIQIAAEIKDNPEWLQRVCDSLSDRLSGLLLAQAESWVRRGQPRAAIVCLERVVQRFPQSRQAELARTRLNQLRGGSQPAARIELQ